MEEWEMNLAQEIKKAYEANEIVGICSCCVKENKFDPYHWLQKHKKVGGMSEVELVPIKGNYPFYSNGICKQHKQVYNERGAKGLNDYMETQLALNDLENI